MKTTKIYRYLSKIKGNKKFFAGAFTVAFIYFISIIGSFILPSEYYRTGSFEPALPPNTKNFMGTDCLGRDILAQLFRGIQNSYKIGFIAATLGTIIGATIGFISGYYGGFIDKVINVIVDVFLSVPSLLFLILIAALISGGVTVETMALIICITNWSWPARQVRAQAMSLKRREFVYLSKLSGMGSMEIIVKELMPHMFQWMGANFINAFLSAVLTEAGLSILGLGPQRDVTLGVMIYWALSYSAIFRGMWWWILPPVVTLIIVFFSLYILHVGLDEIINPKSKKV